MEITQTSDIMTAAIMELAVLPSVIFKQTIESERELEPREEKRTITRDTFAKTIKITRPKRLHFYVKWKTTDILQPCRQLSTSSRPLSLIRFLIVSNEVLSNICFLILLLFSVILFIWTHSAVWFREPFLGIVSSARNLSIDKSKSKWILRNTQSCIYLRGNVNLATTCK